MGFCGICGSGSQGVICNGCLEHLRQPHCAGLLTRPWPLARRRRVHALRLALAVTAFAGASLLVLALQISAQEGVEAQVERALRHARRGEVAAATSALNKADRPGSFAALRPGRRVMPNAVNFALVNLGGSAKKAVSVGLAPGQPPSI